MKAWRRTGRGRTAGACQWVPSNVVLVDNLSDRETTWTWAGADPVEWLVEMQRWTGAAWVTDHDAQLSGEDRLWTDPEALDPGEWRVVVRSDSEGPACGVASNTIIVE